MSDDKAIRVIAFSGKQVDWTVWEEKFMAKANSKGYRKVLLGTQIVPKDDDNFDETTAEGKILKKARDANELAYTDLILSIDGSTANGRVAFNLVRLSKTKDLTYGDARMAWSRLQNKFATKSAPSLMALKKEFTNSRLSKKSEDPDVWMSTLEDLRIKMESQGSNMTDVDFMIHILNNLPSVYEVSQAKLEDRLNDEIDPLTIEEIRTELNLKYQRMHLKKVVDDDSEDEETALFGGGFKGTCTGCGKQGHKRGDCPENRNGNSGSGGRRGFKARSSKKCPHCGKMGHKPEKCWVKYGKPDNANFGANLSADILLNAHDQIVYAQNGTQRTNDDGFFEIVKENRAPSDNHFHHEKLMKSTTEMGFPAKEVEFSSDTWIGDSGASCHMTNQSDGMFEIRDIDEDITIGNGKPMKATKVGKLKVEMVQKNGSTQQFTMVGVKFVPDLYCKLFSVTAALDKGFQIGNKGRVITLQKGDFKIAFDKVFETKTGFISGVELKARSDEVAQAALEAGREININDLHQRLGHPSEESVRRTAKMLDLKVTGKFIKCENCAISKARRKNLNKETVNRSVEKGNRLFIDISSIKSTSYGGKKFWLLVLDDFSDCSFSFFLKAKSEVSATIRGFLKDLQAKNGIAVKTIRCDNAGENKKLEKDSKADGLGLNFEYTAPGTPQQNGRVERKFAALYGRVRSMLNGARVPATMRGKMWAECAKTATSYENLIADESGECSHSLFYGGEPKYARHLRTFGEIAIITDNKTIKGKLSDRGKPCMFLGFSETHTGDTFRFVNLKTNKTVMSRDVIWLNKNYAEWKGLKGVNTTKVEESDAEESEEEPAEVLSNEEIDNRANEMVVPKPRVIRELRGLQYDADGGNPTANEELAKLTDPEPGRETANVVLPDRAYSFIARETMLEAIERTGDTDYTEPKNFDGAWNHENKVQREKWRTAIKKEFSDMNRRGVWRNFKRNELPDNRRCVKNKWVFKVKRNGVFRARLVACGYTQIPGVDFTENYAPVINDVTWRIMLIAMLLWGLEGILIDVECAFLEGELEEEVYMNCPEGLEGVDNRVDCLKLEKSIYGLVQSARQWWKKFVKILRQLNFDGGYADPCLFTRKDDKGIVFIALYVDDCLCIGTKAAIDDVIDKLQKFDLNLKIDRELKDYLSCEIHFASDRKSAVLHQGHIIKSIRNEFEREVKDLQEYRTPGTPGVGMIRDPDGVSVSPELQSRFRMGVGKLLYLVKHTRPDIANAVRELSKMLDCTNEGAIKELRRVVKYVLDTSNDGLKIAPTARGEDGFFDLEVFCDSDFAGDKETRISVAGYIMYLCGVPISWRSKAMKSVTLLSSEAEYVSLSEAAKEVKFITQVIESMGIIVQKPVRIRVDNIGAIFMAGNVTTSPRTKHVDVRYRYVTEFIEDGLVKIEFVRTKDNESDGFTKNLNGELHDKHRSKFIGSATEFHKDENKKVRDFAEQGQIATGRVSSGMLLTDSPVSQESEDSAHTCGE